ncbi:MAG TPA: retropepsin-like aspartic protease [Thermoanaerobaculia bacterium]|jgi:hypothetical protein|nr:retropepsin-like aspartic protease [Thermoanaerobaculia bacterium]
MKHTSLVLAGCLVFTLASNAQVPMRRQGPPPKPFDRSEMTGASSELPMLAGDEIVVEVRVDGKGPYRFLLDTGAAGGGRVSKSLAGSLGLQTVGQAIGGDPTGQNRQTVDIVEVGSLAIGEAVLSGVKLGVRDFPKGPAGAEPGYDGILGIGLFQELLLTLDYPRQRVRIEKGELPPADGKEILEYEDPRGVPQIHLKIGDQDVAADVDSGNQKGELVLPASYLGKVPLEKEPVVVGRGRTGSNEFEIKQAPLKGAVRVGGQAIEHPLVDFVEGFPHGNLGQRFLRRFAVTIDQKNHRIRFRLPAQSSASSPGPRTGKGLM